jgi:hypothetical protein
MHTYRARPDVSVLADYLEVPGIGFVPVNAFVIHAAQPVVVDTGLGLPDRAFVASLADVIDPADIHWIWLTHPDRDHTGGLFALLDAAPQARVVTTFVGAGIMSTERPLPMDRIYLLNPGQSLDAGDRRLTGFRPPLFDNPATVGILDAKSDVCFSSDCFGAPLPTPATATAEDAAAASPDDQHPPSPHHRQQRRPVRHPARRAPGQPVHRPRPGRARSDAAPVPARLTPARKKPSKAEPAPSAAPAGTAARPAWQQRRDVDVAAMGTSRVGLRPGEGWARRGPSNDASLHR